MCWQFGWKKLPDGTSPVEREAACNWFRIAMVESFNQVFGEDVDMRASWTHLCTILMVHPVPTRIVEMKRVGKSCGPRVFERLAERTLTQRRLFFKHM